MNGYFSSSNSNGTMGLMGGTCCVRHTTNQRWNTNPLQRLFVQAVLITLALGLTLLWVPPPHPKPVSSPMQTRTQTLIPSKKKKDKRMPDETKKIKNPSVLQTHAPTTGGTETHKAGAQLPIPHVSCGLIRAAHCHAVEPLQWPEEGGGPQAGSTRMGMQGRWMVYRQGGSIPKPSHVLTWDKPQHVIATLYILTGPL